MKCPQCGAAAQPSRDDRRYPWICEGDCGFIAADLTHTFKPHEEGTGR